MAFEKMGESIAALANLYEAVGHISEVQRDIKPPRTTKQNKPTKVTYPLAALAHLYDAVKHVPYQQDSKSPTQTDRQDAPTHTVARRVFAIFELAEAIILELPARQVLLSQRVSRDWQSVILESTPLQQALLNKPISSEIFVFTGGQSAKKEHSFYDTSFFPHPLMDYVVDTLFHQRPQGRRRKAINRPEASWRRQVLTQPPMASCALVIQGKWKDEAKYQLSSEDGIRLGVAAETSWQHPGRYVYLSGWWSWSNTEWDSMSARESLALMKDPDKFYEAVEQE